MDTYKPAVAQAAIDAGARVINDVSGLRDPELADVCARDRRCARIMHTVPPRANACRTPIYTRRNRRSAALPGERVALAISRGVQREQLILDPGPDFAKTPAQTIELLVHVERLHELERPLLMAISRKDFIGALTGRPPRERLAGTLAALAHGVQHGAHIFRVHDVQAAADFLAVRAALAGESQPSRDLALSEVKSRHQRLASESLG